MAVKTAKQEGEDMARLRRTARMVILIPFVGALMIAIAPKATAATPPRANISYYVEGASASTLYNDGYTQGQRDASLSANSAVILDFGCQLYQNGTAGAYEVNNVFVSDSSVEVLAQYFGYGYYEGAHATNDTSTILELGVGTNNSCSPTASQGADWASVVSSINTWLLDTGYGQDVYADGANDVEPGFDPTVNDTLSWLGNSTSGWIGANGTTMIDYGSSDGCPTSGTSNCADNWTIFDLNYVAYGAPPSEAIPEIYTDTAAYQWNDISIQGGYINFWGSMSQLDSCQQQNYPLECTGRDQGPDTSWSDLSTATGQTPPYSDDIGIAN